MEVSLIGLGRMGTGIVKSLLRAGHRVTVYNRTRERAEPLRANGATVVSSVREACQGEIILTIVADDAALEALAFGESGFLASLPPNATHISLSTISVALSDRLAVEHAKASQGYLAAPVFGRPEAAEAGRLAVVAAGSETLIQKYKLLFDAMGPQLYIAGDRPSMANVVKLTGNFLIATVLESLSEALVFAKKSGLDSAALLDFLTAGLFNAPVYKNYGALIVQGKHEPAGFLLPLGLKDVRLVLQAAEAASVPMPIASVLRDRFITAIARGNQDKDWSVIGRVAAEDAGLAQSSRAVG